MKTINPLHIIGLLFVVLVFFIVKLNEANSELFEAKKAYEETRSLSISLKKLKNVYLDKKSVKKSITTLLRQGSLKSAKITQTITPSSIKLSSQSMDKIALNSLMSKILNGSYNVYVFKIKRLSETRASFSMEIKW